MKYLSIFLLLMPALLLSQSQTAKKDTTQTNNKVVNGQVVITNDGKLRFPDNTVQETAYPGSAQSQGNPPNFEVLNNGVQFPDGTVQTTAYNPNNNPPGSPVNLSPGLYIRILSPIMLSNGPFAGGGGDYEFIYAIEYSDESLENEITFGSQIPGKVTFTKVTIIKAQDANSAVYRFLVASPNSPIAEIHVFQVVEIQGSNYISQSAFYEACFLTNYQSSFSPETANSAIINFIFDRVTYSSMIYEGGPSPEGYTSYGWDIKNNIPYTRPFNGNP